NPNWFSPHGGGRNSMHPGDYRQLPVDMVSWHDAFEFCRRLGELPGERAVQHRYRLPTEAEWEYACRAGVTVRFAWGNDLAPTDANVAGSVRRNASTLPVGSFRPNAWGLFDMHGNVWEWCADEYQFSDYKFAARGETIPRDQRVGHVVRGGDWRSSAVAAR